MDDDCIDASLAVRLGFQRPVLALTNEPEPITRWTEDELVCCDHVIELFCIRMSDGRDHPAIRSAWPYFVDGFPMLPERVAWRLGRTDEDDWAYLALCAGRALCRLHRGDDPAVVLGELEPLGSPFSETPLMAGMRLYLSARFGRRSQA